MKIELIRCACLIMDHMAYFSINYLYVSKYPLSYTVQECAEVWCELVGWKLLNLYRVYGGVEIYILRVEVRDHKDVNWINLESYYNFTSRFI